MRDQIVDFVRRWSDKTEIHAGRFIQWLGIAPSKFYSWRRATARWSVLGPLPYGHGSVSGLAVETSLTLRFDAYTFSDPNYAKVNEHRSHFKEFCNRVS